VATVVKPVLMKVDTYRSAVAVVRPVMLGPAGRTGRRRHQALEGNIELCRPFIAVGRVEFVELVDDKKSQLRHLVISSNRS